MHTRLSLPLPQHFNFWNTIYSDGWCELPPFVVDTDSKRFHRTLLLSTGAVVLCLLSHRLNARLEITVQHTASLLSAEKREITTQLAECFRLQEDLSSFYREANKYPHFRWVVKRNTGRLLRCPTVFEDVVKMMCTTNCSWALTVAMVRNLTEKLGTRFNGTSPAFPTPERLADTTEAFLRKEIRSGYRSPYLLELAERVASGGLNVEQWRGSELPTPELYKAVRGIKGIGDYAASNILKLLGRYDYLGLDSWARKQFAEIHGRGRAVSDATIEKFYAKYGQWKGLFLWMDLTKDWYHGRLPF
jgi:N-glycosylase/DNA lyase